eukprot:UN21891
MITWGGYSNFFDYVIYGRSPSQKLFVKYPRFRVMHSWKHHHFSESSGFKIFFSRFLNTLYVLSY